MVGSRREESVGCFHSRYGEPDRASPILQAHALRKRIVPLGMILFSYDISWSVLRGSESRVAG